MYRVMGLLQSGSQNLTFKTLKPPHPLHPNPLPFSRLRDSGGGWRRKKTHTGGNPNPFPLSSFVFPSYS